MATQPQSAACLAFGPFEISPASGELRKAGVRIRLAGQPLRILLALLARPGEMVPREQLRNELWADSTFVDFEHGLNAAVNRLRQALGDSAENPRYIETEPGRGYRFIGTLEPRSSTASLATPLPDATAPGITDTAQTEVMRTAVAGGGFLASRKWIAAVVLLLVGGAWLVAVRREKPVLTQKDMIVLADFTNSTGDAVFDDTLRQGLAVQLEQSPFLSIISDGRIEQTLKMMGQPADARLTPAIGRELCQRAGGKAVLNGSIAQIGTQYLLTLKAVNCMSGDSLASVEAQASDKNHVLDALGKTVSEMRNKLGESLSTVQRFDTPLEQATTGSLEALQAYSLGRRVSAASDYLSAVPFYQRAISLDPKFAMAYARLGIGYRNIGETALGAENGQKAYDLREQVSEPEKFYIESHYYLATVGDLEKAAQVCEIWAQIYPREWLPRVDAAGAYNRLGEPEKGLPEALVSVRLGPTAVGYNNLFYQYLSLNRLSEAGLTVEEAQTKRLDSPNLRAGLYKLDFLRNDAAGMAQQVVWATGRSGVENVLLNLEGDTAAYYGRLGQAREFSRQAVVSAKRSEETEVAAEYQAKAALWNALFGGSTEARVRAADALNLSNRPAVQFLAALALAFTGDAVRAATLADDLGDRFPENTLVQFYYLPTIRAQVALTQNDPGKAIEILQSAAPYELSSSGHLHPAYVRGESYLAAHEGDKAAAEFQKILDHRGVVLNSPIGTLAHLGLGRAHALSGDKAKAKSAYQDFLTLWKDADPDLPVLKQARAEYAKLN